MEEQRANCSCSFVCKLIKVPPAPAAVSSHWYFRWVMSHIEYLNLQDQNLSHVVMGTVIGRIDSMGLFRTLCSPNLPEQRSELQPCGRRLTLFNIYSATETSAVAPHIKKKKKKS